MITANTVNPISMLSNLQQHNNTTDDCFLHGNSLSSSFSSMHFFIKLVLTKSKLGIERVQA